MEVGLSDSLKASLKDNDDDEPHRNVQSLKLSGRERSASNEFSLPPLPDFDDHNDFMNQDDYSKNQYKSQEKGEKISVGVDLSAIAVDESEQDYSPQDQKAINHLANDLVLDDVDINLDDSDELDNVNNREDKFNQIDNDLNNFDDFANSLNDAIGNNTNKNDKLQYDMMKAQDKELNDLKNIFDKIDEFDNIFGTNSPEALSPDRVDDQATMEDD